MSLVVLIMGLPTSGKSTVARGLCEELFDNHKTSIWLNADNMRAAHNDWDFSEEGRNRQAARMKCYVDLYSLDKPDVIICDMVAALYSQREKLSADFIVWMNTVEVSPYEDTNKAFQKPLNANIEIKEQDDNLGKVSAKKIFEVLSKHMN